MHVVECTIRPRNSDIEKACEWWKKIVSMKGAMYRNYKGRFRFCVKRFGRVLGPLSSGSASLGAPF